MTKKEAVEQAQRQIGAILADMETSTGHKVAGIAIMGLETRPIGDPAATLYRRVEITLDPMVEWAR